MTIILHLFLSVIEPGSLKKPQSLDFARLLETFDSSSLCPECEVIRTAGSRHCIVCHSCVDRYDHHCPWINNCIGIRNHNLFIVYLCVQQVSLLSTFTCSVLLIIQYAGTEMADWDNFLPLE